jgi:CubicO group peptidase (beta-lactamase class C family)
MRYLIFGLFLAAPLSAQTIPEFTDPDRPEKVAATATDVDQIFRDYAERQHFPGFAYGVVVDGELVYSDGFGLANLEQQIEADTRTLFRIASMSKSVTAVAILQLRDAGKLSLDDPVSKYVPEVEGLIPLTEDAPQITIRHLLTHSAGFPEDNPWGDRQLADSDEELRRLIAGGVSFSNVPGIAYEYSNLGFALLGQIVQVVSGMSFPEYTRKNIFEPLGMHSTVWEFENAPAAELALGYAWQDESWIHIPHEHHGSFGAMGGLITSIEDFNAYVALHLSAWPPRSDPDTGPLKRSSLREMHQPWRVAGVMPGFEYPNGRECPSARAYGYGLRWQEDCQGRIMIGHSGGLPGFGSNWLMLPQYGLAVMSFDNRTYGGPASDLLELRRDQLVELWPDWKGAESSGIFADNFFLDYRLSDIVAATRELSAETGAITGVGAVVPENQLRGRFMMYGENKNLEFFFTLSPELDPLIQHVDIKRVEK